MSRRLPLEDVRPTQLYLSKEKLARVLEWFDVDDPNCGSLPAFEHEGAWYFSDGHTRAFVAALAGADTVRIHHDERVREEYNFEMYRTCIDWCAEEGIETIHDLCGRVVEPDTYEECWIGRCQRLGE